MTIIPRLAALERAVEQAEGEVATNDAEVDAAIEFLVGLTVRLRILGAFFHLTGAPPAYRARVEAVILERVPVPVLRARPSPAEARVTLKEYLARRAADAARYGNGPTTDHHNAWMLRQHFAEEVVQVALLGDRFDPAMASVRELVAAYFGPDFEGLGLGVDPGWQMLDLFYGEKWRARAGYAEDRWPIPDCLAAVNAYLSQLETRA